MFMFAKEMGVFRRTAVIGHFNTTQPDRKTEHFWHYVFK